MDKKLKNYIKEMHDSGYSDEKARNELLKAGWSEEKITEALNSEPGQLEDQQKSSNKARSGSTGAIIAVSLLAIFMSAGMLFAYFYIA
ncbi:MAG: hypothetical protein R3346_04855, partial [Candidatus Spechtbacterales bacterium]|nr:hypothetical protein [Candidatus Spechtbacterales bacterium]